MRFCRQTRSARNCEGGYVLLVLMLFVALLAISLTNAAIKLSTQIKRDREIEMIHRGEQYSRAIKRYFKKTGRYPSRIEDLLETNKIRYLRKQYKDPFSQDGSWRIVRMGDVQLGQQTAVGTSVASLGSQSIFSSVDNSSSSSTQQSSASSSGSTSTGSTMFSNTNSAASTGLSGQVLGGGPILGVASKSTQKGIHEFNNKSTYKDWLFIYDPSQDFGNALIKGPYNPNSLIKKSNIGTTGTSSGSSNSSGSGSGTGMPNIPGVSGSGGIFNSGSGSSSGDSTTGGATGTSQQPNN